jgi:catechol 2,3-dioxygenase-like lactoylglutathione lyase family enzyme
MTAAGSRETSASAIATPARLTGGIDHIGVQSDDLPCSIRWYEEFFGCDVTWQMEGGFSDLSRRRLPGISRLVELAVADIRFHLFTRSAGAGEPPPAEANQFQHVCIRVGSADELRRWRAHWFRLHSSGRYAFARPEPASVIDVDKDGMQSFYAYDVNGLEFEFTYAPGADDDLGR